MTEELLKHVFKSVVHFFKFNFHLSFQKSPSKLFSHYKWVIYTYMYTFIYIYMGNKIQFYFQGDDVKTELLSLLNELPELYKGIVSSIGSLKNATHYYEAFVNFLVPRCVTQHTSYSLCKYIYCKLFFCKSPRTMYM